MEIKEGYLELQRTFKNGVVASEVSGIPAEDRAHILQTALSIYPEVKKWVSEFPIILPQRIAATCLLTTAMIPYAQVSTIVDETVLGLILFAEDDLVDGAFNKTLTDEQTNATLTLFARIAKLGGNSTYLDYPDLIQVFPTINDEQSWVHVANSWTKLCQQLHKYPSAATYYEFFVKHVELAVEAQRIELLDWWQTYKKTGACQTYEQYMENARLTILLSINLSSLLVMLGAPVNSKYSLPAPYTNLEELLDELILTACSGVRLANDLRSFERDRTLEQPGSNSLLTLMKTHGLSEKEAEAFVLKEIDKYLQKIETPISLLPSSLRLWGDAVRRVCWAAYHFYLTTEFHHFTKEMLAALDCPMVHGYPLVGLLPELIFNDRIQVLQQVAKQHPGEVVALKIGPIQAYLVTHPDHVQYVLNDNWQNFGKGKVLWDAVRRIIGDNIITNDGESWFHNRRLMQPVFTASQIHSLTELIIKFIGESLSRLDARLHREAVYIDKEMMLLVQSIIVRTLFGSSLDLSQQRSVADAVDIFRRECSRRAFLSFLPKWFPLQRETTLNTALQIIDDTILSVIRERRKSGEDHKDLLSRLLEARDTETNTGMSDKQLRDECVGSFLAGFETTSTTLTWLWYMLNQHPEVENQMRAEINAVVGKRQPTSADLANLQYTKMVIQEVLRQHPAFWLIPRIANTDDVISGYPIKAGSAVLLSPYLTNYLPEFWERPEKFDPERFAPDRSKNRHPYAQFTFGGGPRLCIGKHLALMEMQLIVVMMMQKYRLRLVPGHPVEIVPGVTLRLRHGLKMTLESVS